METKILMRSETAQAAEWIKAGQLVAFPTETVYGLGADATNEESVQAVYRAKGRPSDNPLIVHVAEVRTVLEYVDKFPAAAEDLVEKFWPGPLTLIFSIKKGSLSPSVTGGLSTAAFRMPNNKPTLALIHLAGVPIVGPSANTSGKPSPTTAQHVYHDLAGKIAGILDDGPTSVGIESTVLDLSCEREMPVILRPGAVTKEELEAVIGPVAYDPNLKDLSKAPKAPGMKYKHYAPNVAVRMIDWHKQNWQEAITFGKKKGSRIGLLASRQILDDFGAQTAAVFLLSEHGVAEEAIQNLFSGLRAMDLKELDVLFVETFPEEKVGTAYMNRLSKAANQKFFCKISKNFDTDE